MNVTYRPNSDSHNIGLYEMMELVISCNIKTKNKIIYLT